MGGAQRNPSLLHRDFTNAGAWSPNVIRFISDLHLSENDTAITERFLRYLHNQNKDTQALYILGDFFETWVGDDDRTPLITAVQHGLRTLHDNGIKTYFMSGNRDFLMGEAFCDSVGMQLLKDPFLIYLNKTPTLLMHGDLLCTDDVSYQRFRKVIRIPLLHRFFLLFPLKWRKKLAQKLRSLSNRKAKPTNEMLNKTDATEAGVQKYLNKFCAQQLIHGHTHRNNTHTHVLNNGTTATRYVLGDWKPNQGNALVFDGEKLFFEYF